MRLIDADAIVYTHAIARSIDDGHNWNELCVTKDEIDDMPSAEPERKAKVESRKWRKDLTLIGGGSWSGKCQECGRWVKSNECTYCPSCGAKLEWSDDE